MREEKLCYNIFASIEKQDYINMILSQDKTLCQTCSPCGFSTRESFFIQRIK